jgi:hypothetical protein
MQLAGDKVQWTLFVRFRPSGKFPARWPCGNYIVHYADGSQATLPVRLANNVKRFDTASATRAALDFRYTWPQRRRLPAHPQRHVPVVVALSIKHGTPSI